MSRIIPTVLPLTGDPHTTQGGWQKADQTGRIVWKFQRPTRVEGFEVRDSWNGWITNGCYRVAEIERDVVMSFFDTHVMNTPPRYMTDIYVASSWKNPHFPGVIQRLKSEGFSRTYDFRNPAPGNNGFSWKQIDASYDGGPIDLIKYVELLDSFEADKGYNLDIGALQRCKGCVLILPAGRSACFELGYAMGQGKKCAVLWPESGEVPDLMFRQAKILGSLDELIRWAIDIE